MITATEHLTDPNMLDEQSGEFEPAGSFQSDPTKSPNLSMNERILSVVGGGVLALIGVRRRTNFGALLAIAGGAVVRRGVTGHCGVYAAMGKNSLAQLPESDEFFEHGVHVEESVTIQKSAEELYNFWRHFENLPKFMDHLKSVTTLNEKKSHWIAKAPAGTQVEWDAEIINDEANRLIAWKSLANADVHSAGSVRFIDGAGGQGTEVHVTLEYLPPAGEVGRWIAKLFGEEPEQQVREDLRRFKQFMESGAAT